MPVIQTLFEDSDFSGLPAANPGSGKPWRDPTTGALIVGAIGTFGVSQAYVDAADANKVNRAGDTLTGQLNGTSFVAGSTAINYGGAGVKLGGTADIEFAPTNVDGVTDALIVRSGTGQIDVRGDGGLRIRNLANGGVAQLASGTIQVTGAVLPSGTGASFSVGSSAQLWTDVWQRGDYLNYNAANSGTTNFERGYQRWVSNVYEVGVERAGTGLSRLLRLVGNIDGDGIHLATGSGTPATRMIVGSGGITSNNTVRHWNLFPSTQNPYSFYAASDTGMGIASITAGSRAIQFFTDNGLTATLGGSGANRAATFVGNCNAPRFQSDLGQFSRTFFGAILLPAANVLLYQNSISTERFCLGDTTSASPALKRVGATLAVRLADDSADGDLTSRTIRLGSFTVATLPSPSANPSAEANVSDSSVTTFGSTVAGGGSNNVKVRSNGTNWTVCGI